MTKKDVNLIKHLKPIVKARERQDRNNSRYPLPVCIDTIPDFDDYKRKKCKEAAKMSPRERLMNYSATGDGTYIGAGCNWDLLTILGKNQRFGGL